MAYLSESIDQSGVVALPVTQRVHRRTWLSITEVTSFVMGVLVTLGFTGNVVTLQSVRHGATYSDRRSVVHMQYWPQIQDTLCPVGVPNTTFGSILFSVARSQLGIKLQNERPTRITYRFFHDQFQNGTTYTHTTGTLAYIPIWKAANMAIREWMINSLAELGIVEDIETARLFNASRPTVKPNCVVTAIRDPVSHFLSGYNEIEFRREEITELFPPYYQMPFNSSGERRHRFIQFVTDLLLEDSTGLIFYPFDHIYSMSRILTELDQVGGFLSGYLPSIKRLSDRFPAFVQKTCQLPHSLPSLKESMGKHESSQDPAGFYRAAKEVWSEQGGVAKALCVLHAMDYACWKDLADGIPQLCQEVFSSTEFATAIIDR